MPPLFRARTTFLSILAISSLLASAYVLVFIPLNTISSDRTTGTHNPQRPLELYLPFLNAALALLIAVGGVGPHARSSSDSDGSFGFLSILPGGEPRCSKEDCDRLMILAVVLAAIVVAKHLLAEANPSELQKLKYSFKGP